MINEGSKRLFFSAWVLLHLLVAVFGFLNYNLKDNLTTARATFGITFSVFSLAFPLSQWLSFIHSYCPCSRQQDGADVGVPPGFPEQRHDTAAQFVRLARVLEDVQELAISRGPGPTGSLVLFVKVASCACMCVKA